MNNKKIYKIPNTYSHKILDEAIKKDLAIGDLVYKRMAYETKKQATEAVNELLFKTAKEKGISLYDLCFRTVPEWGFPEKIDFNCKVHTDNITFTQVLKLVPVEFDLTPNRKSVDIDKACKWLKENAYFYVNDCTGCLYEEDLVKEFRKAMEDYGLQTEI